MTFGNIQLPNLLTSNLTNNYCLSTLCMPGLGLSPLSKLDIKRMSTQNGQSELNIIRNEGFCGVRARAGSLRQMRERDQKTNPRGHRVSTKGSRNSPTYQRCRTEQKWETQEPRVIRSRPMSVHVMDEWMRARIGRVNMETSFIAIWGKECPCICRWVHVIYRNQTNHWFVRIIIKWYILESTMNCWLYPFILLLKIGNCTDKQVCICFPWF